MALLMSGDGGCGVESFPAELPCVINPVSIVWFPKIVESRTNKSLHNMDTGYWIMKMLRKNTRSLAKGARFGDDLGGGVFFDVSFDLKIEDDSRMTIIIILEFCSQKTG